MSSRSYPSGFCILSITYIIAVMTLQLSFWGGWLHMPWSVTVVFFLCFDGVVSLSCLICLFLGMGMYVPTMLCYLMYSKVASGRRLQCFRYILCRCRIHHWILCFRLIFCRKQALLILMYSSITCETQVEYVNTMHYAEFKRLCVWVYVLNSNGFYVYIYSRLFYYIQPCNNVGFNTQVTTNVIIHFHITYHYYFYFY